MRFVTWLLTYAAGLAVAAWLLDGIWFDGPANGQAELQEKIVPLLVVALILGLGSTFIEPVIKLSANPRTVRTMGEHVDLDVSGILRREMTLNKAGEALIDITMRTCNGRLTAAETLGHREFVLTKLYRSA